MGCSPDFYQTPEELAEEARANKARILIRHVPLRLLNAGDLIDLMNCYHPAYSMHTWDSRDTDVLVAILKKTGRWR